MLAGAMMESPGSKSSGSSISGSESLTSSMRAWDMVRVVQSEVEGVVGVSSVCQA